MVVRFTFLPNINIILRCTLGCAFHSLGMCTLIPWWFCFIFPPVSDLLLPKCVKIVSINTPLDDPTRALENYGILADRKKAELTDTPVIFRIHKGLMEENGTVSLEALDHPRFFLRHKNYHFHLEKEVNNSMFCECFFFSCLVFFKMYRNKARTMEKCAQIWLFSVPVNARNARWLKTCSRVMQ